MFVVILTIILISNAMESREYRRDQRALRGGRKMKRFAVLLLTLAMAFCCAAPAFAAGTIEVTEDVSVSGDYD